MVLSLKDVFLTSGAGVSKQFQIDMSDVEHGGRFPLSSPIFVSMLIENKSGSVLLSAEVAFELFQPCDRCLQDVKVKQCYSFAHKLVESLNGENDDYVLVEDGQLDVESLLREDILLNLPTKVLCNPDCKGICSICGANLNEHSCECDKKTIDPRLAVLKQLID